MKTIIALNGACGRMCQRIAQLAHNDQKIQIGAALEYDGHPSIGKDYGEIIGVGKLGIPVQTSLPLNTTINSVIDFSLPEGTMSVLKTCVERTIPLVIATTGHSAEQKKEIQAAAHRTAILQAPNMSLAVNLLFKLVRIAGETLKDRNFDVEILERHHRFKKDSPSGTALHFARILQDAMAKEELRHGREGLLGERPSNEIGVHAIRVGDNVGEHTIVFSTLGETIELTHRAHSRDCYAQGALQAAVFLADRPAGNYSMNDVLGL